jgi:diguanylate cyclase (GGDEF)-like protein
MMARMLDKYMKDVIFSLVTFFLLVIVTNIFLFPEIPGFIGLNPHPYLIVVLLMSGRFGLREGLISAVLASLILSIYVFLENRPFFTFELLTQTPILLAYASYFLAAFIVGEMRGFSKSYERDLVRQNQELRQQKARLEEQLEIVTQIKEELENRIIGQEQTVLSLYQATKALETLDEKEFYQALTQLTARFTGATRVTLFMIDYSTETLQPVAQYGWEDESRLEVTLPLDEGIFDLVLRYNQLLTIKEISDDPEKLRIWEKSTHRAYVYVPISMVSVTVGILTVDDIPFLKLNISTIRILSLIAELAVPALKNIIKYQDLQEMVRVDPVTGLPKYEWFLTMAEAEFKRTERYGQNLSLLLIELEGLNEIERQYGHDARVEALKWFTHKLRSMLRSVDIIGRGEEDSQFVVALPMSGVEAALMVIDRIRQLLDHNGAARGWRSVLKIYYGEASYHPSLESLDQMLKLARQSLKLQKVAKKRSTESNRSKGELGSLPQTET